MVYLVSTVVQPAQGELLQVVLALIPSSRFSSRLDGRKQQRDKDADDRDDDQQLDKCEGSSGSRHANVSLRIELKQQGAVVGSAVAER